MPDLTPEEAIERLRLELQHRNHIHACYVVPVLAALDTAEAERDRAVAHQLAAERERLWAANELAVVVERLEAAEARAETAETSR